MSFDARAVHFTSIVAELGRDPDKASMLIAGSYGVERFASELARFAAASSVPLLELVTLLEMLRQVVAPGPTPVPDQHVVTQSLMKEFCTATPRGPRMGHYSLKFGPQRPTAPRSVAKIVNFVKIDSQATENLWGETERHLPAAIAAAHNDMLFGHAEHERTIRNAIALHYARSFDVYATHHAIWGAGLSNRQEQVEAGLYQDVVDVYESGVAFRLRVVGLFRQACRRVEAARLRLLLPPDGYEFLLGDASVITADKQVRRFGIRGGVPIGQAENVTMPLGPRLAVALAASDDSKEVGPDVVRALNTWQVLAAHRGVFWREGSGLDSFPASVRPVNGPRRARQGA